MKDYTWHQRLAGHTHYRWFAHLVEMHRLTRAWLEELQIERAPYLLDRGILTDSMPEIAREFWILDSLDKYPLEHFLDDTRPEDVLQRLDHTVWAAQAYTLGRLIEGAPEKEHKVLESVLEQTAWKLGRKTALERWEKLSEPARGDLRVLVNVISDVPFYAGAQSCGMSPVLVRRAIRDEFQVELFSCPHESPYVEVRTVADFLCQSHLHWLRGFGYGLNHRLSLDSAPRKHRCEHRWHLIPT